MITGPGQTRSSDGQAENHRSYVLAGSRRAAASARPERGGSNRPGKAFSLRWLSRGRQQAARPEAASQRRRDDRSATVTSSRGPFCSVRDTHTSASGPASEAELPIASEVCVGSDETHNYGETERELLLRPEAGVLLGRDVRQCWPTARFVRFLQLDAADPSPRTHRRAPRHRESKSGAGLRLPNLLPTHYLGSLTAARPVDLAAAIAQIRASASPGSHDCHCQSPSSSGR
jgi:hypothetical protein